MTCLWAIILLSFTFLNLSEARHQNKLHSAVVVGTVYCDTCFNQDFSKASHFIPGASVAVECEGTGSRPGFRQEAKTNEHGEFKVHLPFLVSKHVKKIRGCSVKLIRSGEPYCAVAGTATSSSLHLKSRKEGTHIFSAGFFTFKPLKQPELCAEKPIIKNSKELNAKKSFITDPNNPSFLPPIHDPPPSDPPALGFLPPVPQLPNLPPLPGLPNLPSLPGLPGTPPALPKKQVVDNNVADSFIFPPNPLNPTFPLPPNPLLPPPSVLPPNPLLPPPSIFPPNPFQPPPSVIPPIFPSPPPSIFPPILPTPSPSPPSFNLPPLIPGLIPSPSPPPPSPSIPFIPIPPFPFQPIPGFPGVPPADVSTPSRTSSP